MKMAICFVVWIRVGPWLEWRLNRYRQVMVRQDTNAGQITESEDFVALVPVQALFRLKKGIPVSEGKCRMIVQKRLL